MELAAQQLADRWCWRATCAGTRAEVCFVGKGAPGDVAAALRGVVPAAVEPAWLDQIHSATVVAAGPGANGDGDALYTRRRGVALAVVTADCVPVLLAAAGEVAAVHAGWRGLAQWILSATLQRFDAPGTDVVAWIGPAIGPCCYEVGEEVAEQVIAVSTPEIARPGLRGRPHLDLVAAARTQLRAYGVREIRQVEACTRCDARRLWSYRRDGPGAGRNVAAVWLGAPIDGSP